MATWCPICCTNHSRRTRCPGELRATGEERNGWRVVVETPSGMHGYGVLLAEAGHQWRARILTFPRTLWSVPGGGGSLKFVGRTPEEAERRAAAFIRKHCLDRHYAIREDLMSLSISDAAGSPGSYVRDDAREIRIARVLPVLFGEDRPILKARTGNLSTSGMFIRTVRPLGEHRLVGVSLELEQGKVPLRGAVVWARSGPVREHPPGMGLRLLNPPPIYVRYIQALDEGAPS
jgi:Tfp pilus assembly protein PilZ